MIAAAARVRWRAAAAAVVYLCLLAFAGCGGGGGDGSRPPSPPPPPPPPPPVQTGVFKDANVSGLDFSSGQQAGTTDASGRYTCETGSPVTFSVGAVTLGQAQCTTLSSPPALVASGEFDDPEAVNIARFLQLLDLDADPTNGIEITTGLQQVADSWPAIDFAAADLDSQLTIVFSDIQSVDNRTVLASPDAATAFAAMDTALSCAYAGTFLGSFSGSATGTAAFVLGRSLRGRTPDDFIFLAYDPVDEFQLTTGGPYSLSTRSRLDSSPVDPTIIVQADFTDPDTLAGTWNYTPDNASGTLTASRVDDTSGFLRFAGSFSAVESSGVLSLSVDESGNLSGTAYDIVDNGEYAVSGLVNQVTFDLTISDGNDSFVVSSGLSIGTLGELQMRGDWDDGSGGIGTFGAVGCQLN